MFGMIEEVYITYLIDFSKSAQLSTFFVYKKTGIIINVIKLRNDGFEGNTKNVLLFFLWKI